MIKKLRLYWSALGVSRKLSLTFGSIVLLISIVIFLCLALLNYIQDVTERQISNSGRIKNLVLELSLITANSRRLKSEFFLQYNKLGYIEAYKQYIEPVTELQASLDSAVSELRNRLHGSIIRQESNTNLNVLFRAYSRYKQITQKSIELVAYLTKQKVGMHDQWHTNLKSITNIMHTFNATEQRLLDYDLRYFSSRYMVTRQLSDMQSSFARAEGILTLLANASTGQTSNKNKLILLLKKHIEIGRLIVDADNQLQKRLSEYELQANTLTMATAKLLENADKVIVESQAKVQLLSRIVMGVIILSLLIALTIVFIFSRVIGDNIAGNLSKLSGVVREFDRGNLESRIQLESKDEIGSLAASFNNMASNIKSLICDLELKVENRTKILTDTNEKLKQQQELFQSIFYNIPVMIMIYDPLIKHIRINKHFEQTIGWTNDELMSISLLEECYPDSDYRKKAMDCMQSATADWCEFQIMTKSGKTIDSIWSNIRLSDDSRIGIGIDTTERNRQSKQIALSLKEKETMLQEIYHRVKNNMQVISGLLGLQASNTSDKRIAEALKEAQRRVYAMAAVHEMLYGSGDLTQIDFRQYLSKVVYALFQTYSINASKLNLNIESDDVYLNIEKAIPLGLVVNELITNSLKYAFPGNAKGTIDIVTVISQQTLILVIKDDGIGMPIDTDFKASASLGLHLVQTLIVDQLDGNIEWNGSNGTEFIIKINI